MVDDVEHESKLVWNDDESWAFPVLPVEENGGKALIEGGRIVTEGGGAATEGKKKRSVGGGSGESADDHELHIWTERERRKKMRNMFATLHEFIPHLHPRADKSTIIDEAVEHIKHLQETVEELEKLKEAKLKGIQSREAFLADQPPPPAVPVGLAASSLSSTFRTWSYPNVVVNVCGNDAHINIVSSPRKPGIMSYVVFMMDKYNLDFVSAHVSSDAATRIYMIHARANVVPQHFPEAAAFLVEETYKQLASDLMLWMNS